MKSKILRKIIAVLYVLSICVNFVILNRISVYFLEKLYEKYTRDLEIRVNRNLEKQSSTELYPDIDKKTMKEILEAELKFAVNSENYERANEIKNQIDAIYGNETK